MLLIPSYPFKIELKKVNHPQWLWLSVNIPWESCAHLNTFWYDNYNFCVLFFCLFACLQWGSNDVRVVLVVTTSGTHHYSSVAGHELLCSQAQFLFVFGLPFRTSNSSIAWCGWKCNYPRASYSSWCWLHPTVSSCTLCARRGKTIYDHSN